MRSAWTATVLLLVAGSTLLECLPLASVPVLQDGGTGFLVESYLVDLSVDDGGDSSFDVRSIMTLRATEARDVILVNAKDLDVSKKVTVYYSDKNNVSVRVQVKSVNVHADRDEVEINLDGKLAEGQKYEVTISATGTLGQPADLGLVRVTYQDADGDSWLVAFRGSARRVFPCLDAPGAAANVTLRVSRPSTHTALSNTDVAETETIAGTLTKDTFRWAMLAPHQIGLVVAPLRRSGSAKDAAVSIWARAEAASDLADVEEYLSALTVAVGNVSALSTPADHLSVVALAGADATATAGLVALDEEDVLGLHVASPSSAHRDALLALAEAVGEPAVRVAGRPQRWGDEWTLRSLAAHLRHRYADMAVSGWRLGEQQGSLQVQDVLDHGARTTDVALPSSHDGDVDIGRAAIDKGALLFRLLENLFDMDKAAYHDAIHRFYQLSEKRAVSIDDLLDVFTDAMYDGEDMDLPTGVTPTIILGTWTGQPGYPVVTVVRDYEKNNMVISQKKFSWSGSSSGEWFLPLSLTTASESLVAGNPYSSPRAYLVPGENHMEYEYVPFGAGRLGPDDWLYFNIHQTVPYRVNYDATNWRMLTKELQSANYDGKLQPAARAHLLGDALALARAGELNYAVALDLSSYLRHENDVVPWQVARSSFSYLEAVLDAEGLRWLRSYESLLLNDVYLDGQFEISGVDPTPDVALLWELTASWACRAGHEQCLKHADEEYARWRADQGKPPKPDLVQPVLCRAVSRQDATQWVLTALAGTGKDLVGGLRRCYVNALSCAPTKDLLKAVIDEALASSGTFLASEASHLLLTASSSRPHGWGVVTEYLRHDAEKIAKRVGGREYLKTLSLHLASKVSTQDQLNKLLVAVRAVDSSLVDVVQAEALVNLAWVQDHAKTVVDWLKVYVGPDGPGDPTTAAPALTDTPTSTPTPTPTGVPAPPSTTPTGGAGAAGGKRPSLWTLAPLSALIALCTRAGL